LKIVLVTGARPNFMKIAPIAAELRRYPDGFTPIVVHTGQHYDYEMSEIFFTELELPPPDHYLNATGVSMGAKVADIISKFDPLLLSESPDLVLVVGDASSTLACAVAAATRDIPVAHVEAGLRSGDRRMPEEINRLATDAIADLLFTPSADADENLAAESVPSHCIHRVGNVMIDTLLRFRSKAAASSVLETLNLTHGGYALVTLHRQSNVDDADRLRGLLDALDRIQQRIPIVFPVHPRTRGKLSEFGFDRLLEGMNQLTRVEPLGYADSIRLQEGARLVLVDSGGIQEETTVLGIPCLTLRENTERPVTVTEGTNKVVGCEPERIVSEAFRILDGEQREGRVPDLWDGQAASRIVEVLQRGVRRR